MESLLLLEKLQPSPRRRSFLSVCETAVVEINRTADLHTVRIMRVLTAIGFAAEAGVQSYVATPLTKAITKPSLEAAVKIWYVKPSKSALQNSMISRYLRSHDNSAQVQMKMPEYFRSNGYVCPTDSANCAFQWTFDTKLPYFEHIHRIPESMNDFNTFMSGNRVNRKHWIDWYPVETEILSGTSGTPRDT